MAILNGRMLPEVAGLIADNSSCDYLSILVYSCEQGLPKPFQSEILPMCAALRIQANPEVPPVIGATVRVPLDMNIFDLHCMLPMH